MSIYYPLAVGNQWVYGQTEGVTFTNTVTAEDPSVPGCFTMVNSALGTPQYIRKEGDAYLTDSFEAGNFQVLLRDDLKPGDTWDIRFTANGIESVLSMTVKEKGVSMDIGGKTYDDLLVIEGESRMLFNGNLMPLNFFTKYHYSPGVGLVLTTSTGGVSMPLVSFRIVQG
jgi:hypothetical protein